MSILIESMTKITHQIAPWKSFIIRVWRQEANWSSKSSEECAVDCIGVLKHFTKEATQDEVAVGILAIDRVNTVEVIDQTGAGCVLYKDWP